MPPPLADEIRRQLERYLTGETSLEVFDDWFVPVTWDVDRTKDQSLIDRTYEIILRLAEYSNGDCSEVELKYLLQLLVPTSTPILVRT